MALVLCVAMASTAFFSARAFASEGSSAVDGATRACQQSAEQGAALDENGLPVAAATADRPSDSALGAQSIESLPDKIDIGQATISVADAYWTGFAVTPQVTITYNGATLAKDEAYSFSCSNNREIGTATCTITGTGAYAGSVTESFRILPFDIADATVSSIPDRYKDGNPCTPCPFVRHAGTTLTLNTAYTLSYANNVDVGTATVTITGKGGCTGSRQVSFKILGDGGHSVWSRLYGDTALDTMQAISKAGWESSSAVVIATESGYWDALAASSLAGVEGCPILLTDSGSLSSQAASEIQRLGATTAYVCGGTAAISASVEGQIRSAGCSRVLRLAGDDARGTARAIAGQVTSGAHGDTCVIATAGTFQDALSVSPYAYAKKSPIYLCEPDSNVLSGATLEAIRSAGFGKAVIVGGPAAVSSDVESQLASDGVTDVSRKFGQGAYDTSEAVAKWCISQGMSVDKMAAATGESFYDALAGGALCGKNNSVLVLLSEHHGNCIHDIYKPLVTKVNTAYVLGGPAAIDNLRYYYCLTFATEFGFPEGSLGEYYEEFNKKFDGLTASSSGGYDGRAIVMPAGGIDWDRDLRTSHRWVTLDATATTYSGFRSWGDDINDEYPPYDSMVYGSWIGYEESTTLDRSKYPQMDFNQWKHAYLKLTYTYWLDDTPAYETMARFGYPTDAVFLPELSDDEALNRTTPGWCPSVSMDDVLTPPQAGAMLFEESKYDESTGYFLDVRAYEDDFLVSYSIYGGTWSYYTPVVRYWLYPADWVLS